MTAADDMGRDDKASMANLMKPILAAREGGLTCGFSCLSALSALLAKLVVIAGGEREVEEGEEAELHWIS